MMWVMPMSMSSHTTQKLYVGLPSDRARIRSSSSALSNSTRPLTWSSTTVEPLSSDRKRIVNGMPSGNGTAARSEGRQVPSYIGLRFASSAACRLASRVSGEHTQG